MAMLRLPASERLARLALVCALIMLLVGPIRGTQVSLATIGGLVRDEAGGVLPGASVTLSGDGLPSHTTATDQEGSYVFRGAPPGRYQLVVTLDGFATVTRRVIVNADSRQLTPVTMRVALDQRVEVIGSLEDFRRITGFSPAGLTLGPDQLGVLPNDPDVMLQMLRELSATSGRADAVTVYVDGQPIANRLPPKEAIQSIRISTNSFASEFAEPSAGLVEIVTKPASTSFRGESQATFNDSLLNARNFFEQDRRPSRTQGYTGYLGGPIVPGRWSFLAYGGRWQRDERLIVNTTIVDPESLTPRPFLESVATPSRVDSYSVRSDFVAAKRHLFAFEYARTVDTSRGAGLESGLDLPERAINRDIEDDSARVAAVSTFGPFVSSEFRARLRRRTLHEGAVTTTPAVLVLDAYNSGGNQAALRQDRDTRDATVTQVVSYADDLQSIRGGLQVDLLRVTEQRQANHGGTFVFGAEVDPTGAIIATPFERYLRTRQGLPGYGPSYFSIARGAASIGYDDWQVSWFLQDDVKHTDNVTLSLGVRHGIQKHARRLWQDVAPRVGIGWTPGGSGKHVVRFATGLFYSRLPPEITLDSLRYDGAVVELVVERPDFFQVIPEELTGIVARPTVRVKDRVRAPLTMSATSSYEWQVAKSLSASIAYTYSRGQRLLRTRNLNAPDPMSGLAPDPQRGPVLQFEASGRSEAQELRASMRRVLTRVNLFGTYLYRLSMSETDGPYTIIADAYTAQGEYGRAADDERHRVMIGSWISLPGDMSVSGLFTYGSGRPFNITTGLDNNGDLLFLDRPAAAAAPGSPGSLSTAFGNFDLQLDPGQAMILRNAGQGPRQFVLNVGFAKVIRFDDPALSGGSAPYVILGVSAENVTNRVNFADFNGVVSSPLFGTPNRALNPRRVELTLRFGF
jgi:hypothetical protein